VFLFPGQAKKMAKHNQPGHTTVAEIDERVPAESKFLKLFRQKQQKYLSSNMKMIKNVSKQRIFCGM